MVNIVQLKCSLLSIPKSQFLKHCLRSKFVASRVMKFEAIPISDWTCSTWVLNNETVLPWSFLVLLFCVGWNISLATSNFRTDYCAYRWICSSALFSSSAQNCLKFFAKVFWSWWWPKTSLAFLSPIFKQSSSFCKVFLRLLEKYHFGLISFRLIETVAKTKATKKVGEFAEQLWFLSG